MKRNMIIALVLALSLLLCACGSKLPSDIQENVGQALEVNPTQEATDALTEEVTNASTEETTEATTEEVTETPTVVDNPVQVPAYNTEYWNDVVPAYSMNQINVSPRHVYWDGNTLVAECYIVSGLNTTSYNFELKQLTFENHSGMIADAYFGQLEGLSIAPYSYAIWTFHFSADVITQQGADLSYLKWSNSIHYNY